MTYNYEAEQILTLARIGAELQDSEQTKAQFLQTRFDKDNLNLRGSDTKRKYRVVNKNLLDEDFRRTYWRPRNHWFQKRRKGCERSKLQRQLWTPRLNKNLTHSIHTQSTLWTTLNRRPLGELITKNSRHLKEKIQKRLSKQCRIKSMRTWEQI
ncbi:MAG: hypothetical protein EZS28_054213 [Streblomastix strix]|uniref:Uncharacterized protein n=1 Tax=Streblomastix strix TaxID=222440 RepID=A0A5J4QRQ8_9EUKA|nr:MAG: hypothetical protein EZS28_054213 [Streblomastix strix]